MFTCFLQENNYFIKEDRLLIHLISLSAVFSSILFFFNITFFLLCNPQLTLHFPIWKIQHILHHTPSRPTPSIPSHLILSSSKTPATFSFSFTLILICHPPSNDFYVLRHSDRRCTTASDMILTEK